jgi:hypothetical protein
VRDKANVNDHERVTGPPSAVLERHALLAISVDVGETLGWGIPGERFAGSGVEFVGDSFEFVGTVDRRV